jgi:hypothetical protein
MSAIRISGAVATETTVTGTDLAKWPVARTKVRLPERKGGYGGSFECEGVPLRDVLSSAGITKQVNDGFNRELDLVILVTGKNGNRALFSYGEIFLGSRSDRFLLSRGFRFLYPHKHAPIASATWDVEALMTASPDPAVRAKEAGCLSCHAGEKPPALFFPKGICLVAPDDAWPGRFVEEVSAVQVLQMPASLIQEVATQPKDVMWLEEPVLIGLDGKKTPVTPAVLAGLERKISPDCSYGLGKGFHGIHAREGVAVGGLLQKVFGKLDPSGFVVLATSPDRYRSVFSGYEVLRQPDSMSLMLIDQDDGAPLKPGNGKYKIWSAGDFYIDRSLRSVAEIRLIAPEPGRP